MSECASSINADFYVNIQGDEPMIDSVTQEILIEENENIVASGAFMPINDPSDIIDSNVVKVTVMLLK